MVRNCLSFFVLLADADIITSLLKKRAKLMKPNFKLIRTDNYQNNSTFMIKSKFSIDPNDWKRNPYTFLKSRFYIEASNVIIYLFVY